MRRLFCFLVALAIVFSTLGVSAQAPAAASSSTVPNVINFSSSLTAEGKPLTGIVGVTFSLYRDQQGGAPLWMETQNVQPDKNGRYTVALGSTMNQGLPAEVFTSGEARWLAVQVAGQAEQPRIMLLSVPYALKAGDAATVGGLPPSAFMLAGSAATSAGSAAATATPNAVPTTLPTVTGSGTPNYLPLWNGTTTPSTTEGNSVLFQSGSGSTAKIGINTTTPSSTLDVKGSETVRGTLNLSAKGTASSTATAGFNSQAVDLAASAWNTSGTPAANSEHFRWQAEPAGSNTASPSGTLNLLFASGSGTPTETGLNIASNGVVNFVTKQTFPGTGTITGVTAGTDLTGGGTTGAVTLNVDTTKVVTGVVAGTDLTGGGTGGVQTLNLDTTKIPQLSVPSTFTANTTFSGGLTLGSGARIADGNPYMSLYAGNNTSGGTHLLRSDGSSWGYFYADSSGIGILNGAGNWALRAPGSINSPNSGVEFWANGALQGSIDSSGNFTTAGAVSGTAFSIEGNLFAYGSSAQANAFLGFAGNTTTTGTSNVAAGGGALGSNTSGSANVAMGGLALRLNTQGTGNAAIGQSALGRNSTGSYNTASGYGALFFDNSGNNNTGDGAQALENTSGSNNTGIGYNALFNNAAGDLNTAVGAAAGNDNGQQTQLSNSTFVGANTNTGTQATLTNATAVGANAQVTTSNALVLGSIKGVNSATADTNVGIGTTAPGSPLSVVGNSTYIPVAIQSPNTFGTWMTLANTSTGGATWNILSAASGNSEGAGNLAFTNFNASSTVYIHANLHVDGTVSKGGGSFQIDHPLDPANKYLYHSFVESPDMMNIYNGVVTLNAHGAAWITMPDYFEALNRDFRYQLTSIGRPQPDLYIAREIAGNRFRIAGGKPGARVSWQVTGIRHDAYADAHRIPVVEDKPSQDLGKYLHPELYGAPQRLAIGSQYPADDKADRGNR